MTALVDSHGRRLPPVEVPSPDKLRTYGDLAFLAFRSARHQAMTVATLRWYFEPAVELGQFRIFRFDEVPRGMFTWGWLGPEAERRLIAGEPLAPDDWQSGGNLWVIDLIAPYRGLTQGMVRWIMEPGNLTDESFHFRRVTGSNTTRRIVRVDFTGPCKARILRDEDFLDR